MAVAGPAIADSLSGHSNGFGLNQGLLVLAGLVLIALGLDLAHPSAAERFAQWHTTARALLGDLPRFSLISGQVLLVVLVARQFRLDPPAFSQLIVPVAAFGFVAHQILPERWRLRFFVGLSLVGILLVMGPVNATWLLGLLGAIVGLSYLPLGFGWRLFLILAAGTGLAFLRAWPDRAPWSAAIWPVLGSMLMFRYVIYLYDLKHAKSSPEPGMTAAYFLMLPNVVFPLFPVVDFATFRKSCSGHDRLDTAQRGVRWMLRGIVHLLLYRLVYQQLTLPPEEVVRFSHLVQYILATFLLYLRISGSFHLIIGMLHLFGFRLPETHHLFYLASGFSNFWRRINIYWKDFMMKVVFYPVYFPLRKKRGETTALVAGTVAVFAITWLTHSWQWFWILGRWLFSWTDGLFWAILALLLVLSTLRDVRRGRARFADSRPLTTRAALGLGVRVALTFTVISVLWSLWDSPTLGDWFDLLHVSPPTPIEIGLALAILIVVGTAGVVMARWERRLDTATQPAGSRLGFGMNALTTAAGLVALWLVGSPAVAVRSGPDLARVLTDLRQSELNRRDAAMMQRGYYENLMGVSQQNSQLWELYAVRPGEGVEAGSAQALRTRDDFLGRELTPLVSLNLGGRSFTTNHWGMRDHEYAAEPAPGTYRIALLGQSYVAGDGVSDGETFEAVAEEELRADPRRTGPVEILNFAVSSYTVLQQVVILDRVLAFKPNALFFVFDPRDGDRAALHLVRQIQRGVVPPFEELRQILREAGVDSATRETEALSRLAPFRDVLLDWAYARIVSTCRDRGVEPVWIYLTLPERGPGQAEVAKMVARAHRAGFLIFNWSDVYAGRDLRSLQVSPWDFHPNAMGHRVIADRLVRELTTNSELEIPS